MCPLNSFIFQKFVKKKNNNRTAEIQLSPSDFQSVGHFLAPESLLIFFSTEIPGTSLNYGAYTPLRFDSYGNVNFQM